MSNKKENILKRLGEYLDTIFTSPEVPIVEAAIGDPIPPIPPEEAPIPAPKELKVGDPLPDGEYEIMDQVIVLKDGKIESVTPKEPMPEESEEEMAKKKKAKCDADEALKTEFEDKLSAQKAEFELKLSELSKASKTSGIIQAPVEKVEPKIYTAKEIIMRDAEYKRNNK